MESEQSVVLTDIEIEAREQGFTTIGDLVECVVDRGNVDREKALKWVGDARLDNVWDELVGPMIDRLEDRISYDIKHNEERYA